MDRYIDVIICINYLLRGLISVKSILFNTVAISYQHNMPQKQHAIYTALQILADIELDSRIQGKQK